MRLSPGRVAALIILVVAAGAETLAPEASFIQVASAESAAALRPSAIAICFSATIFTASARRSGLGENAIAHSIGSLKLRTWTAASA